MAAPLLEKFCKLSLIYFPRRLVEIETSTYLLYNYILVEVPILSISMGVCIVLVHETGKRLTIIFNDQPIVKASPSTFSTETSFPTLPQQLKDLSRHILRCT